MILINCSYVCLIKVFPVLKILRDYLGIDCRILDQKRDSMPSAVMTQYLLPAIVIELGCGVISDNDRKIL